MHKQHKQIKYLVFSIILVTLLGFVACKSPVSLLRGEKATQSKYQPLEDALLWKLSGKELVSSSFIYGTIHIIDEKDFFFPTGTLTGFNASEQVVFEIDMDKMDNIFTQMGLLNKILMNDDILLSDLISKEDYRSVSEFFEAKGFPMFFLERIKPMFLSALAEVDLDQTSMEGMKSYEMEFHSMAKAQKKKVHGLETIDYQVSIFDSIPYQVQADMLVESIKTSNGDSGEFDEMVEMYVGQKVEQMYSMMEDTTGEYSAFTDLLVNNRNENWIPEIIKFAKKRPSFFAVGAGHLGGPKGIINLLREEGYTLEPLSVISNPFN